MATKVNVMKLLQEVRGFAQLTNRRPHPRTPGPLLLQAYWFSRRGPGSKDKRTLRIRIDNLPDIPHPVKINHVTSRPSAGVESSG